MRFLLCRFRSSQACKQSFNFGAFSHVKPLPYNGINNGLQLLLDAETFDYALPLEGTSGFIFAPLHHLDIAILKQTGTVAGPGQALRMSITPTLTKTEEETRFRFDPVERQCYFDDEIKLAHLPSSSFR